MFLFTTLAKKGGEDLAKAQFVNLESDPSKKEKHSPMIY